MPEDKLIWDGFITKAIAERRVVEIARFEGMKSEVELLFNNSAWTKVVALCDEELERSSRVISDENRYFWSEYRKKAEKEIKKIQLEREIKTLEAEKASLTVKSLEVGGDLASDEKLGEELVDWIMQMEDQTSLQQQKKFEEFNGRSVIVEGTVNDIGNALENLWGVNTIYVSLNATRAQEVKRRAQEEEGFLNAVCNAILFGPEFAQKQSQNQLVKGDVDIKFLIADSYKESALKWNKGDRVKLRGEVSSRGDFYNDLTIRNGVPVTYEDYQINKRIRDINIELDSKKHSLRDLCS